MKALLTISWYTLVFVTLSRVGAATGTEEHSQVLTPGFKIECPLGPHDRHPYTANLANGGAIRADAYQEGVDLVIDVYDPDGKKLATLNSMTGTNGPVQIDVTALQSGAYRFVIHTISQNAKAGKYRIQVAELLSPTENAKRFATKAYDSPALLDLWQASQTDAKAMEVFLANRKGMGPIIEAIPGNDAELRVTYLYPADEGTESVVLSGGPDASTRVGLPMKRFLRTNLFFCSQIVPKDARYSYTITANKMHYAGAHQEVAVPETVSSGRSVVELPGAPPQPYVDPKEGTPRGRIEKTSVKSNTLHEDRTIYVYTPAGYDGKTPCNLLLVLDGEVYGGEATETEIPTPTILDNLIDERRISPLVAVLIADMGKRNRDLTCSRPFAEFMAKELVPWIRSHYRIHSGARHVIVAGSSFGGLCATYCALLHPETFGNVLSQSGSYWVTPDWQSATTRPYPRQTGMLIEAFKRIKRIPVRFYLEVGYFEAGGWQLASNRNLRDVLLLKGYEVTYAEFSSNHDSVQWRGSLADGLLALIGRDAHGGFHSAVQENPLYRK